jgi:SAM-dependent methyltransferase
VVALRRERTGVYPAPAPEMLGCMTADFAGSTAKAYRRFRRDVPAAVLDRLVTHLGLGRDDRALDLGAGTGQVAVGLAARLRGVLAFEPEPDMLLQLRQRTEVEQLTNVVCALAADFDLPALARATGEACFGLLTVANALHWMDTARCSPPPSACCAPAAASRSSPTAGRCGSANGTGPRRYAATWRAGWDR